ncbi:SIMPL domain-containing protein [Sphingomonas sp. R1]|uniref:SIMPL domain-containing protein n=1 Tax=Sphingomonas sp. R1 TaxID=399176 RepID=UPI002224080B|nr:SIMPL domain-containing protein [Sphingomonas sp. R1]UYY76463.1 SIMPL domain-containing protein [Sphingomonas sp. R1]
MIRTLPLAALIALAAAPHAFAQTATVTQPIPADGTVLDINAEGSSTRVPDLALIQAGVVTTAASAGEAMQQNAARMAAVLAALRKAGIAERDLQTSAVNLAPQYRYQENKPPVITGYQASNQLSVRFRDVARSGTILDALVAQGANNISGPNLTLADEQGALDEARRDAIAKARARATLYAQAAGLKVDRILMISETGSTPIVQPMPMLMRAKGMMAEADTAIIPGEQKLTASVSVRFLLK